MPPRLAAASVPPTRLGCVEDLFAPPGNAWRSVSPRLRVLRRAVLVVSMSLVHLAAVVAAALLGLPRPVVLAPVALLVALLAWGWWAIGRNTAAWGYAERDEELYIKHGAVFRALVAVPYGRMQYVDVSAGPLYQAFRIARVHLHTAAPGTSAVIPGLPAEEAARLRDRLTALGEAQTAGL